MATPAAPPSFCPRCAYDLQGETARWHPDGSDVAGAACPLEGTCSECGLRFEWRFIRRPDLIRLRWFCESPRESRRRFTTFRTAFHALRPRRFWNDVRLEAPFHQGRLLLWSLVLLALALGTGALVIALSSAITALNLGTNRPASFSLLDWQWAFRQATRSILEELVDVLKVQSGVGWPKVVAIAAIMMPLMLMLLPWTRAQSKVRFRHVLRAGIYALAPLWLMMLWTMLNCTVLLALEAIGLFRYSTLRDILYRTNPLTANTYSWLYQQPVEAWWLVMLIWFPVWWGCAFKIGFRMPDWRQALLAITLPTLIVQLVVLHLNLSFSLIPRW